MKSCSPYQYCFNNPIMLIDPSGADEILAPIFDRLGNLLGCDDAGMQGKAIIMDASNFSQGMKHADALEYSLGYEGLANEDARIQFNKTYDFLSGRPDWNGYITIGEATEWYRNGNGKTLFADFSKIELSSVHPESFPITGDRRATFNLLAKGSSLDDGLVYGNITLRLYPNNCVKAFYDKYDFDQKSWWNPLNWGRNIETWIGGKLAGNGIPFSIQWYGSNKIFTSQIEYMGF